MSEPLLDRIRLLKRGVADFAIVTPSEVKNEMDSKFIAPNEMILVGSAHWIGRELEDILATERLIAYHSDDSLGTDYLKKFNLLSKLRLPRLMANDNEMVLSLVKLGMGFALLSKEMALPFLEQKSLIALNEGKSMNIRFALTWYPRSEMPGYFRGLIDAIK
jgi:DNA-binding transcriptional LysR family regulator